MTIKTILQGWQGAWPTIKSTKPLETGVGVLDESAFNTIEVDNLFAAVNHASTTIGQATIYRSLAQPSDDLQALQAKQDALIELREHEGLRLAVENILETAVYQEKNFYLLLFGEFLGSFGTAREDHEIEGYGYLQYKRGVRLLLDLVDQVNDIGTPNSPYLKQLFDKIKAFSSSRAYHLMVGPAYIAEAGIQSKVERQNSWSPAVIFKPNLFKPLLIGLFFGALWALMHFFPSDMFNLSAEAIPTFSIFFVPLLLVYYPVVGGFDRDSCIIPLRNIYRQSEEVAETLDALGQLDELISFIKFADAFESPTVLPDLIAGEHHQIILTNAKNPVLAKGQPAYVGNDFALDDDKLVLVTGPNSGGKTAFCKTITQIQVLAQIGCYVPAEFATLTVADRVFYQVGC